MTAASHAEAERPSAFARRVGPVVAVLGVLGTIATGAWVALSPDNVVGPIHEAPFTLEASALVPADEGSCVAVVAGDGDRTPLCSPLLERVAFDELEWTGEGDVLLYDGIAGEMVRLDPGTGEVVARGEGAGRFGGGPDLRDVLVDTRTVWADSGDGEVLLDLGRAPGTTLRTAAASPDGAHVVAVTTDGRVLVAATTDPDRLYEWFEVPDNRWYDPHTLVRWSADG